MTIANGAVAPNVTLPDATEGVEYDLREALQRGPVVLGIYKSSCEASKVMFRMLEQLRQAYPADKLTVWGVAQDSPNITRSFIRRGEITFPILVESDGYPASNAYDIEETPTVFLIDQEGTVVWQTMGFQREAVEELSTKVAELINSDSLDIFEKIDDIPAEVPG